MYYVSKRMEVAGSHSLKLSYESKCQNLHGHNWIITVYCKAKKLNKDGIVCDFKHIKEKIHDLGKMVAIETNGTREVPSNVDWVTVSPKEAYVGSVGKPVIKTAQEVKIILDGKTLYADPTCGITAAHYFVQPCDTGDEQRNREIIEHCVNFVKANPKWKLSLQTQKILRVR